MIVRIVFFISAADLMLHSMLALNSSFDTSWRLSNHFFQIPAFLVGGDLRALSKDSRVFKSIESFVAGRCILVLNSASLPCRKPKNIATNVAARQCPNQCA